MSTWKPGDKVAVSHPAMSSGTLYGVVLYVRPRAITVRYEGNGGDVVVTESMLSKDTR